MASTTLSMLLTARDEASGVFRQVGTAAGTVERSHGRLARSATVAKAAMLGLGAAALGSAVYFAKDSVQAYAAAEKAQISLQAAYAKYPKLASANIESIRSLNTALQAKTRFDDDDLAVMQSRLAAFDLTGQQLQRLTPLVADYASKTGRDVVSSGDAIGKALLGNTRALKSVGISYTATGNKAKDFTNIVGLLQKKVGGFAESEGKTAAGKLAILDNQFGELKETVGRALLPYLTDLVDWMTSNMPAIQAAVAAAMPKVREAFTTVADAAKTVGSVLKNVWDAFEAMPDSVKTAAADLAAVGIAFAALKKTGVMSGGKLAIDIGSKVLGKGGAGGVGCCGCCSGPGGGPGKGGPGGGGVGSWFKGMLPAAGSGIGLSGAVTSAAIGAGIMAIIAAGKYAQDNIDYNRNQAYRRAGPNRPAVPIRTSQDFALDKALEAQRVATSGRAGVRPGTDPIGDARKAVNAARIAAAASHVQAVAAQVAAGQQNKLAAATNAYGTVLRQVSGLAGRNTAGIRGNSTAAAANRRALSNQATAAKQVVAAYTAAGKSSGEVGAKQRAVAAEFVRSARQMGATKREAAQLARQYKLLPKSVKTATSAPGAKQAVSAVSAVTRAAKSVPKMVKTITSAPGAPQSKQQLDWVTTAAKVVGQQRPTVTVSTEGAEATQSILSSVKAVVDSIDRYVSITLNYTQTGNPPKGAAVGGRLSGPGSDTSDSIVLRASNDEYVVRARSARAVGYDRLDFINRTGRLPRFRKGGVVGGVPYTDDPALTAEENAAVVKAMQAAYAQYLKQWGMAHRQKAERYGPKDTDTVKKAKDAAFEARQRRDSREMALQQAKNSALDRQRAAHKAAADARQQAYLDRRSQVGEGLQRVRDFGSVAGIDFSAQKDAADAATDARRAVSLAATPQERQAALMAAREADVKAARAKVTPASVTAWLQNKLTTITAFRGALEDLKKKGVGNTILAEVAGMDPDSGLQVARVLKGVDTNFLRTITAGIDTAGAGIGLISYNANAGSQSDANRVLDAVMKGAGGQAVAVAVTATLQLDGRDIYTAVKREERRLGKRK